MEIIIKAEDQAQSVIQQNENKLKKLGDVAQQANQKAVTAEQKHQAKLQETISKLDPVIDSLDKVGEQGAESFEKLSKSQQDAVVKFNMLDEETQTTLRAVRELGGEINHIDGAEKAVQSFSELDSKVNGLRGSIGYAKSEMELMGQPIDGLTGKLQVVGNGITTYVGNKWDTVKTKVSSFGSFIKSNLSSALSSVKSKIESIGSAFSGLGGVISSVIGGIGVKELGDMTIGASVSRDRIFNLSYAVLGAGESMDDFKNKSDSLWNLMDSGTNNSLVSLDQISQAMSTINMSANASQTQLKNLEPIILDIGQRAILMGKDGNEAVNLMQAAGKGLNGEFEMLRENLGITKDKLKAAGWKGSADDIDGYTKALETCLSESGDVSDMMNTTYGKLTRLKKYWGLAGRSLGDEFLPYVDKALDSLVNFLDANNDGALDASGKAWIQYAYGAIGVASGFATLAPSITPAITAFDMLTDKTKSALQFFGLMKAEEDALTLATLKDTLAQKMNAVAKAAGGTAAVAEAGANTSLTASFWAMSTAILSNPITWLIVALIALAAVVYKVGESFGWWHDIPSMLGAIWSGIQRIWAAFINNPQVKEFLKEVSEAWNAVCEALKPVTDWARKVWDDLFPPSASGSVDIVREIIDWFGWLGRRVAEAVGIVKGAFSSLMGIIGTAYGIGQSIYEALKPIVCILLGCSPGIVPALRRVAEVFATVWNGILSWISGVISSVISAIQPILNVLTSISEFILGAFKYAWDTIIMVFSIVRMYIFNVINIFTQFLNGQISLTTMLSMLWNNMQSMFFLVFSLIISRVGTFAKSLISRAISAGRGFVNGIISFISSLPGRVATYLYNVVSRIASAGASWVSTGISKASAMVSGVINHVNQLPGKVYTEFVNIGSRIMSAGSDLVNKAKNIGKNIVDGLLGAMGIHSPGIIQEKVVTEFENMVGRVKDQIKPAGEVASEFGKNMVDSFGTPDLTVDTGIDTSMIDLDDPAMNLDMGVDTSAIATANESVITSYDGLAENTGLSLQNMVQQDQLAYNAIRSNDQSQLSAISSNLNSKMNTMSNKVKSSMDNMLQKNKSGLVSANNTTKNQLTSITNATVKANQKMISSWNTMKEGIVQAASKIKNDSTKHFTTLESTIGKFYHKLQNPGGFGAGPGNGRISNVKRTSSSSGFKKITQAMRNAQLPTYLSLGEVQRNPLISKDGIGEYVKPGKNNRFRLNDLIRSGNIKIPVGFEDPRNSGAGWSDGVGNHVQKIKDKSKNWSMKGPKIIGKYQVNKGFKVKDFINGAPKIDFATFKGMAEDVFSQCHYDFYYDSDKYGNWMTAFQHGYMNCSDSSDALIALAHACGLTASKVHGHWNQYGHFWANVAGHKMDTTGWMNQRNWTPSASHAGPAPKSYSFKDLFNELKSTIENNNNTETTIVNEDSTVTLDGSVKIIHEFLNLPDNVSAEEVAKLINDTTTSDNWIKALVKNNIFQKWDLKEKMRLESKANRAKGV